MTQKKNEAALFSSSRRPAAFAPVQLSGKNPAGTQLVRDGCSRPDELLVNSFPMVNEGTLRRRRQFASLKDHLGLTVKRELHLDAGALYRHGGGAARA